MLSPPPAARPLPANSFHAASFRADAMAAREPYTVDGQPFASAEEAWFWAVLAQDARAAGARVSAGQGLVERPCEAQDVLRVVDRLHRSRKLLRDHLHVLVHYGRRQSAPDPERFREQRAELLWRESFAAIAPALRGKGIVR